MPLKRCQNSNQPGWKWGDQGHCYVYTPNDAESELAAKKKALKQAAAMGELPGTTMRSNESEWEWRTTPEPLELRDSPNGGHMFVGYAWRYGVLSQNMGGFVERLREGSGTKTIQEQDLRALFNHNPDHLLGRKGAGTLRIHDDGRGGRYEIDQPDTTLGRDLAALVARGDIYGSSFTFKVVGGGRGVSWTKTDTGFPLREVRQFQSRDVGPVTFPAYSEAGVALRSFAEFRSLPFEEVVAAAADERLAELLGEDPSEDGIILPADSHRRIRRYY
jgi:Escherichia/Staphylococcus phage prohead protease